MFDFTGGSGSWSSGTLALGPNPAIRATTREQQTQLQEEQRMDELLEKIQREGKHALTDEEQRFLKRVADKYRNR